MGLRLLDLKDNLAQAREVMRFKATHDTLTGVWNRGMMLETLDREAWRSRRECFSLGVLIADLDHFNPSMTHTDAWRKTLFFGKSQKNAAGHPAR
jgi:GGDEF domain-containing protein